MNTRRVNDTDMAHNDNENNKPIVSVVIPVYDQSELLDDALNSVKNQTFDQIEAIVVDDNSNEIYDSVIDQYGDWIQFVKHNENRGAAAARNTGIKISNGKYIAFLDADDQWRETKIEKQYSKIIQLEDNYGLVYTGYLQQKLDNSENHIFPNSSGHIYKEQLLEDQINPTSTVMVRRECLDDIGKFNSSLPSRQDYELWIRISEKYKIDYVDEILVEKREQPNSISNTPIKRIKGDIAVYQVVKDRVSNYGLFTRNRILSYHHHTIAWDYLSGNHRNKALYHLAVSLFRYPIRLTTWGLLIIALLRINRDNIIVRIFK